MKKSAIALLVLCILSGCDSSNISLKVGDEVTFKKSPNSNGRTTVAADKDVLREMTKTPAEYAKVVDQIFAEKRVFGEYESSHAIVLSTDRILGKNIVRMRIKDGLNPDREAWAFTMQLEPVTKP